MQYVLMMEGCRKLLAIQLTERWAQQSMALRMGGTPGRQAMVWYPIAGLSKAASFASDTHFRVRTLWVVANSRASNSLEAQSPLKLDDPLGIEEQSAVFPEVR